MSMQRFSTDEQGDEVCTPVTKFVNGKPVLTIRCPSPLPVTSSDFLTVNFFATNSPFPLGGPVLEFDPITFTGDQLMGQSGIGVVPDFTQQNVAGLNSYSYLLGIVVGTFQGCLYLGADIAHLPLIRKSIDDLVNAVDQKVIEPFDLSPNPIAKNAFLDVAIEIARPGPAQVVLDYSVGDPFAPPHASVGFANQQTISYNTWKISGTAVTTDITARVNNGDAGVTKRLEIT